MHIGSRLELFVDRYLVEEAENLRHVMHTPTPAEKVLTFPEPWEGLFCGGFTVLQDGPLTFVYYRGMPTTGEDGNRKETTCLALSVDGVHFTKPQLDLYEFEGSDWNNLILAYDPPYSHNFCPFLDSRPGVPADERFKAVAGNKVSGLHAFLSGDGIHWRKMQEAPIITAGVFDTQNLAFWSEHEGCYCCYYRTWTNGRIRTVSRAVSPDFREWSEGVEMDFGGELDEQIYTNQTQPYFRAPHIYIGLAARFVPKRGVVSEQLMIAMGGHPKYAGDTSDAVLLTSRGGNTYDRTFRESFVRPGMGLANWTSRTNYPGLGIIPAGDSHIAFYIHRNYGQKSIYLQRMLLRTDGFASFEAPYDGGAVTTKPFTFAGSRLVLNLATSAIGAVSAELQDPQGRPMDGFTLADCDAVTGDEIAHTMTWNGSADVSALAGKPVRLHLRMTDANLYSFQFSQ